MFLRGLMMSLKQFAGYHVAAILFIASQYDAVFALWFDVACRLQPFILARLEQWATDLTLLSMFGLAGETIRALRQTVFCIDALHGQLHNWACQQRFLGMLQRGTTWNRGGMLVLGMRAHNDVRRQQHSTRAGSGSEALNHNVSMMGLKYYAEIPRLEVAHEALGDRCLDTMNRLPIMLLRDYKNVRV
jgi:uncharacterized membrane protein YhdT